MKREILVPSTVISMLSLSMGLFILSVDRLQTTDSVRTQSQERIIGSQFTTKQQHGQLHDQMRAVEEREHIHERREHMKQQSMKWQITLPSERFAREGGWI